VQISAHPQLGDILVDGRGMTLYRFIRDGDRGNCYSRCAELWSPFILGEGEPVAGPGLGVSVQVMTRHDGTRQITYAGMPLYYFALDRNPGDANGQGMDGLWFVVEPLPVDVQPAPTVRSTRDERLGVILTDVRGMTLYRFSGDAASMSNCYDQCAAAWPPLLVRAAAPSLQAGIGGTVGAAMRRDGTMQVTYNEMPLYRFSGDTSPGDTGGVGPSETRGVGIDGNWFAVPAER
jgi:predicted lipoprotein with Yx(FWY)xxD motif